MSDLASLALAYCREDFPDLTLRQLAVFSVICDSPGPHQTAAVASRLGVSKPVITRATNALSEMGIARRAKVPGDKRRCVIEPTEFGRQFRANIGSLSNPSPHRGQHD